MLRVFKASGEAALTISFTDCVKTVPDGKPIHVLAIKRHLQRLIGQPRFKQRLVLPDGQMLSDDAALEGPMDVQLILQAFEASSLDQIKQLQQTARDNNIPAMEQLLQRPQDPDLDLGGASLPALHMACECAVLELFVCC